MKNLSDALINVGVNILIL